MYRAAGCFSATNRAGSITGLTVAQPMVLNRTSASETRASAMASNLPRGTDLFLKLLPADDTSELPAPYNPIRPVLQAKRMPGKSTFGPLVGHHMPRSALVKVLR